MRKIFKRIFKEILWVTLSLCLTVLFAFLLLGHSLLNDTVDLHLGDTLFVLSRWYILTPLFFLVTFTVHLIVTFTEKFNEPFANWVLLFSGLTLIITLTFLIRSFTKFSFGFTLYPPLSALGPDKVQMTEDSTTKAFANFLTVVQGIILSTLIFAAYRFGRQKWKEK